jgi:hypothetical protein
VQLRSNVSTYKRLHLTFYTTLSFYIKNSITCLFYKLEKLSNLCNFDANNVYAILWSSSQLATFKLAIELCSNFMHLWTLIVYLYWICVEGWFKHMLFMMHLYDNWWPPWWVHWIEYFNWNIKKQIYKHALHFIIRLWHNLITTSLLWNV